MVLLNSKIWPTWAPKDTVIKSFKKCGVAEDNLDIEFMHQDKFASADLVTEKEDDVDSTPGDTSKSPWNVQSPLNTRKDIREYWKEKYQKLQNAMKDVISTPISPEEISKLTKIEKFKVKKSKNFRITQVCGSLRAKDILSKCEELEAEENEKKMLIAAEKEKKDEIKKDFLKCKDGCQCGDSQECKAIGLKQCTVCFNVLKSQCNKANCKLAAMGKPAINKVLRL